MVASGSTSLADVTAPGANRNGREPMSVKSAARTLEIYGVFARAQRPLSLSELSRLINCPSSSCYQILRTLEAEGFIYQTGPRKSFYPTRKMFDLCTDIANAEPWLDFVIPILRDLRDECRETVMFGKLHDRKIIYLTVLQGLRSIRYHVPIGDTELIHCTSVGKALIAALPLPQRDRLIDGLDFRTVTDTTITDADAFRAEIERTHERDYAETNGEGIQGVMAIAKAVSIGSDMYAVAIGGPVDRMEAERQLHLERLDRTRAQIAQVGAGS